MSDRALIGNAADPKQVKKAKQYERQASERKRTDLQSILSTIQGRRVLWGLLSDCGVFRLSLAQGQPDVTGFNEGRRSIGLGYMAQIQAIDPTLYHRMAQEAHDLEQGAPNPEAKPDTEETES